MEKLEPSSRGINMILKVIKKNLIVHRRRADGTEIKIAEVTVGDETGTGNLKAV
eukprot:CAMPEP_0201285638 /NCGR_PEP_ID=MMETSP1317-20130820/113605_1 /ASSEMBLY_ACC=CAM_ASM_000770 /TAXON_ID=187299 /ORGANISM="Undescribed Undescribed, Strain Undescribed" /LENGTH=53 /DNA_ID=CAMNT_0047611309 /DNA_START=77 /DNA_END=238 /DNA_ORIENTATION=-